MRLTIQPSAAPGATIDVTNAVVSAIAKELSRFHDGNDTLNWIEAEKIVQDLLSRARGHCAKPERSSSEIELRRIPVGVGH
jgi:hypothetical protein